LNILNKILKGFKWYVDRVLVFIVTIMLLLAVLLYHHSKDTLPYDYTTWSGVSKSAIYFNFLLALFIIANALVIYIESCLFIARTINKTVFYIINKIMRFTKREE
jgi:hypothetical protein